MFTPSYNRLTPEEVERARAYNALRNAQHMPVNRALRRFGCAALSQIRRMKRVGWLDNE
jgi:hypothetical protein